MLIRRLRGAVGADALQCIGTSATWPARGRRQRKGPRRRPCGCASLVRIPPLPGPRFRDFLRTFCDRNGGQRGKLAGFRIRRLQLVRHVLRSSPHTIDAVVVEALFHRLQQVFNVGGNALRWRSPQEPTRSGTNTSFKRAAFSGASTSFNWALECRYHRVPGAWPWLRAHRVACRDPAGRGRRRQGRGRCSLWNRTIYHAPWKPGDRCGRSGPGKPIRPDGAAALPGAAPALTTLPSI